MKKKPGAFLAANGYPVSVSFAPEPNEAVCTRLKEMLLASYNGTFADSDKNEYNAGGETNVP